MSYGGTTARLGAATARHGMRVPELTGRCDVFVGCQARHLQGACSSASVDHLRLHHFGATVTLHLSPDHGL